MKAIKVIGEKELRYQGTWVSSKLKQTTKNKVCRSITRILAYFRKDLFSKNILNVKIQAKGKHNKERVLQVSLLWRALAILASEESQTGNEKVGKKWKQ